MESQWAEPPGPPSTTREFQQALTPSASQTSSANRLSNELPGFTGFQHQRDPGRASLYHGRLSSLKHRLCALFRSWPAKRFKGLELGVLQAAEGKDLVLEVLDCKKKHLQFVYKYNLLTCIIIIIIIIIKQTNKQNCVMEESMDVKSSSYPCHYRTFNSNV